MRSRTDNPWWVPSGAWPTLPSRPATSDTGRTSGRTPETISPLAPKGDWEELLWPRRIPMTPICSHLCTQGTSVEKKETMWGHHPLPSADRKCFSQGFSKSLTRLGRPSSRCLLKPTLSPHSSVNGSRRRRCQEARAECGAERPGEKQAHWNGMIWPVSTARSWGSFPLGAPGTTVRPVTLTLEGAGVPSSNSHQRLAQAAMPCSPYFRPPRQAEGLQAKSP